MILYAKNAALKFILHIRNNSVFTAHEIQPHKYDNSMLKKINQAVAFADCSPSHSARVRLLCAFTEGEAVVPPPDGGYPNFNAGRVI